MITLTPDTIPRILASSALIMTAWVFCYAAWVDLNVRQRSRRLAELESARSALLTAYRAAPPNQARAAIAPALFSITHQILALNAGGKG